MTIALGVALVGMGCLFTGMAAVGLRVLLGLLQRGPQAADDAFENGDSVRNWWEAAQTPMTLDGPRDSERLAFGARSHIRFGEVLVEERASTARHAL